MAATIPLMFWPSATNCLSWSKDNLLAIGGSESVAILTPRLKEPAPDGSYWDSMVFSVSSYTNREVPHPDRLHFDNFSIGEELSLWSVQALAWSSPGLGRHGQCVLTVLTTNHVLSIWMSYGNPATRTSWKRPVIVNHAVQKYYRSRELGHDLLGGDETARNEQRQVQQRIRAFAWSSPLYDRQGEDESTRCLDFGHHFLAVATEAGDILILKVTSPYSDHSVDTADWDVSVLSSIKCQAEAHRSTKIGANWELCVGPRIYADQIAWGDWTWDETSGDMAPLAFIVDGRLLIRTLSGSVQNSQASVKPLEASAYEKTLPTLANVTGPLQFERTPDGQVLLAFGENAVHSITPDSSHTHHLDDRWDAVSGVAIVEDEQGLEHMHIASLMSSMTASTTTLRMPLLTDAQNPDTPTSWQKAVVKSKVRFSADNELDGRVLERVWGIASSPFREYVATCVTIHAAEYPAYVIPSERLCVVDIRYERGDSFEPFLSPAAASRSPSIETLFFSLQRYFDHIEQADVEPSMDHDAIVEQLTKPSLKLTDYATPHDGLTGDTGRRSTQQVIRQLRLSVYFDSAARKARALQLADAVLDETSHRNEVTRTIAHQLTTSMMALSSAEFNTNDAPSLHIRRLCAVVRAKLDVAPSVPTTSESGASPWYETCTICGQDIALESLKWARCVSGHQFSRCGLAFVAIQEPGATKTCGICDVVYRDEAKAKDFKMTGVDEVEMVEADDGAVPRDTATADTRPSLARVLYAACDVCVYCGGKFVS